MTMVSCIQYKTLFCWVWEGCYQGAQNQPSFYRLTDHQCVRVYTMYIQVQISMRCILASILMYIHVYCWISLLVFKAYLNGWSWQQGKDNKYPCRMAYWNCGLQELCTPPHIGPLEHELSQDEHWFPWAESNRSGGIQNVHDTIGCARTHTYCW